MSCSFIEMKSDEVKKLAQACLDRIETHKEREWNDALVKRRKEYERSWWRRLWNLPMPTDDAIMRELRGHGPGIAGLNYLEMMIENYGWHSKERAEQLLRAAARAEVVQVSAEDLSYIGA